MLRPATDTTCLGFKEVRYGPDDVSELPALLAFMAEIFEDACFIFNVRDLAEASRLGQWTERPDALEYLTRFEKRLRRAHEDSDLASFWVSYDDYSADPASLEPLFDFLGEPMDLPAITATLSQRHGPRADQSPGS